MAIHIHVPKFGCLNIIFGSEGLFCLHGRSLSWWGNLMVLQWETETEAWNWAPPLGVQFLRTCFMNSIFQSSRARINSATDEDCNWSHVMKTPCLKWPKTGSAIYSPLKCPKSGRVLVFISPPLLSPHSHFQFMIITTIKDFSIIFGYLFGIKMAHTYQNCNSFSRIFKNQGSVVHDPKTCESPNLSCAFYWTSSACSGGFEAVLISVQPYIF